VDEPSWPWPAGAATGVGSLPGTDFVDAVKLVFGELADLPHLPELPDRGPGAEMIGRTAGLLTDLPVDLYAGRWRLGPRAGVDARRTRDLLERDLDALTDAGEGYVGPLKVQAAGPWTLAAGLDLAIGGRVLHDPGATRDLAASLAEGLRAHVAEVVRRVPGARVLLQIDEPSLPSVLAGRVPTESGLHTLRAVPASDASAILRSIVDTVGAPVVVHCCDRGVPLDLLAEIGAVAVSLDVSLLPTTQAGPDSASTGKRVAAAMDALGSLLDAGTGLFAGCVPTSGTVATSVAAATAAETLWRQLGFPLARLPEQVVVTPACGLAGTTRADALARLKVAVEAGRRLAEHRE
jgi:methionine synthase II (cobalamin-independent)